MVRRNVTSKAVKSDQVGPAAPSFELTPTALADLIRGLSTPARRRSTTVVVVECNREQMRWSSRHIEQSLNIRAHEILLDQLEQPGAEVMQRIKHARCFVTTHYHWDEVCQRAAAYERPVLQIRLNPRVFEVIVRRAQAEPIGLIGMDRTFLSGFTRALAAVAPSVPQENLRTAEVADQRAVKKLLGGVDAAFVSPLCAEQLSALRSRAKVQVLSFENIIAPESLETLEAVLIGA